MNFKLVNIKPCDNTFFGDGNQFNFDISKIIKSKNTPYPSVFFGAIFTAILANNDEFRKEFFRKESYDHEKILNIGQVYLVNEEDKKVYIKAPIDLFINSKHEIAFGIFEKNTSKYNCLKYEYFFQGPIDKDYKRVDNMYINIKNIYDSYSKRNSDEIELKNENKIFIKNNKIGIGIDKDSKNVEDGKLYKIQQTEFLNNDWSYMVEYDINQDYLKDNYPKIKDLESGYLKLGGENKVCKFKTIKNKKIEKFNLNKIDNFTSGVYKIIFTSETYFAKGIESFFESNHISVLGISNDKPIYIGGYDMKKGKGCIRKMYKGYSAGTVVLVKVIEGIDMEKICELFKNENVKGFNRCVILKEEL